MEISQKLYVLLQMVQDNLHPVSRKIVTTALSLGESGKLQTVGILLCARLSPEMRKEIMATGLTRILVLEGSQFACFRPEQQTVEICKIIKEDGAIFLVPATPEGRTISAMVGAYLHTGVTADCTGLAIRQDGFLLQTRPAFSGNIMANIITRNTRPQIASLRFGTPGQNMGTEPSVLIKHISDSKESYPARWLDRPDACLEKPAEIILAVGGGIRVKEDVDSFQNLATKMRARLCCSRVLVDRGWLPKSCQIGLSGGCISAKLLVTFGISGSVQFQAGLDRIGHLISLNEDPNAPIMQIADTPILGDLYEISRAMLQKL